MFHSKITLVTPNKKSPKQPKEENFEHTLNKGMESNDERTGDYKPEQRQNPDDDMNSSSVRSTFQSYDLQNKSHATNLCSRKTRRLGAIGTTENDSLVASETLSLEKQCQNDDAIKYGTYENMQEQKPVHTTSRYSSTPNQKLPTKKRKLTVSTSLPEHHSKKRSALLDIKVEVSPIEKDQTASLDSPTDIYEGKSHFSLDQAESKSESRDVSSSAAVSSVRSGQETKSGLSLDCLEHTIGRHVELSNQFNASFQVKSPLSPEQENAIAAQNIINDAIAALKRDTFLPNNNIPSNLLFPNDNNEGQRFRDELVSRYPSMLAQLYRGYDKPIPSIIPRSDDLPSDGEK